MSEKNTETSDPRPWLNESTGYRTDTAWLNNLMPNSLTFAPREQVTK